MRGQQFVIAAVIALVWSARAETDEAENETSPEESIAIEEEPPPEKYPTIYANPTELESPGLVVAGVALGVVGAGFVVPGALIVANSGPGSAPHTPGGTLGYGGGGGGLTVGDLGVVFVSAGAAIVGAGAMCIGFGAQQVKVLPAFAGQPGLTISGSF